MFAFKGLDQNPGNASMTGPINVDTTIAGFVDTAAGTWGVSSTEAVFGATWPARNGPLLTPAGIRVVNVWNVSAGGANTCYTTVAVPGMENGAFPNYNAQFNLVAAPV